ncbi:CsgG/HfaB family protein [Sphingomonas panni]
MSVAVYNFVDQTGQFKTSDNVQTLSRAVTQGSTSILIKALQEAGNNSWFTVIEREKLDNLLRERAVIREMRAAYLGEKKVNPQALPPLLFAGVLLEGGIIGYDSNTKSGGSGARFLGIGGSTQYREDTVTIYLRAISVRTGEVLTNISVRKSIASVGINANAFRYVAFKDLLELEAGIAYNEPDALALQSAIETAVYGLIVEGAAMNLWCLNTTPDYAQGVLRRYYAGRDNIAADKVVLPTGAGAGRSTDPAPARGRSRNVGSAAYRRQCGFATRGRTASQPFAAGTPSSQWQRRAGGGDGEGYVAKGPQG